MADQSPRSGGIAITALFPDLTSLRDLLARDNAMIGAFVLGALSADGDDGLVFECEGPGGSITAIGIEAPAPGLADIIQTTRLDNRELAVLSEHGAHLICSHRGDGVGDGVEQTRMLFAFAAACGTHGCLGIIHTPARQCFRQDQVTEVVRSARDLSATDLIPIFVNRVPLLGDGYTFHATRGASVYDLPELCVFDHANTLGATQINRIIDACLAYLAGGAVLQPGHTAEFDGVELRIEAVDADFADYIKPAPDVAMVQLALAEDAAPGAVGDGRLAVAGIVAAALMVAAIDGSIDRKELDATTQQLLDKRRLALVGGYFAAAAVGFQDIAGAIVDRGLQHAPSLVGFGRDEIADIHGAAAATEYARAVHTMASRIAEASGGFLGFGSKVSEREREALAMIAELLGLADEA